MLNRRHFIRSTGLASASCLLAANTRCIKPGKRPNILFIFTDDHAFQAISAYGGRLEKIAPTPHIDRLAHEGMRFDKCYVTNSICAPSRASILTGKHSHLNGVLDNRMSFDGTQQTFPKLMQKAGYFTAMIGKWHLKTDPTGFDYWEILPGQGNYYNPDFKTTDGSHRETGYVTDIVTDKAIDWMQQKTGSEQPFMMMLQHKAPHRPWLPGPEQLDYLEDVEIPEPENLFDTYDNRGTAAKKQDMSIEKTMRMETDLKVDFGMGGERHAKYLYERFTEKQRSAWDSFYGPRNKKLKKSNLKGPDLLRWKYQNYLKDYLRCIKSVDDNVGRVLNFLDESGLTDNTVVIYSSDQGFYLGEHGWFDKRFMYEESYRTPLLVRWPGVIKAGSENVDLVSNLDFAQTFLQIAGGEQPVDMQGSSLLPLLKGRKPADWRQSLYYHYYEFPAVHSVRRHEGVASPRYKLMHFYDLDEWELYDLDKDPSEMNNVYGKAAYQQTVTELKEELVRLKRLYQVGDPPPLAE